jgi:hypothetical protein
LSWEESLSERRWQEVFDWAFKRTHKGSFLKDQDLLLLLLKMILVTIILFKSSILYLLTR